MCWPPVTKEVTNTTSGSFGSGQMSASSKSASDTCAPFWPLRLKGVETAELNVVPLFLTRIKSLPAPSHQTVFSSARETRASDPR